MGITLTLFFSCAAILTVATLAMKQLRVLIGYGNIE